MSIQNHLSLQTGPETKLVNTKRFMCHEGCFCTNPKSNGIIPRAWLREPGRRPQIHIIPATLSMSFQKLLRYSSLDQSGGLTAQWKNRLTFPSQQSCR